MTISNLSAYDSLISFLDKRINSHSYKDNYEALIRGAEAYSLKLKSIQLDFDRTSKFLYMISQLILIKEKCNSNIYLVLDEEISKYFDSLIIDIACGKIKFSIDFPLYGNKAFIVRLINYYIDNEEYEKCAQLKKLFF